jgi:hypothetical protein
MSPQGTSHSQTLAMTILPLAQASAGETEVVWLSAPTCLLVSMQVSRLQGDSTGVQQLLNCPALVATCPCPSQGAQ